MGLRFLRFFVGVCLVSGSRLLAMESVNVENFDELRDPYVLLIEKAYGGDERARQELFEKIDNFIIDNIRYKMDLYQLISKESINTNKCQSLTDLEMCVINYIKPQEYAENRDLLEELKRRAFQNKKPEMIHVCADLYMHKSIFPNVEISRRISVSHMMYQQAANLGYAKSYYALGLNYRSPLFRGKVSLEEAESCMVNAANLGFAAAQNWMGEYYKTKDPSKAIAYLYKASSQGFPKAYYLLGQYFFLGIGVERDYVKACAYFREAASCKILEAYFMLGSILQGGFGLPADYTKAFRIYQIGADLGSLDSEARMGEFYVKGLGIPKNEYKGILILQKLADKHNALALYLMGEYYEESHIFSNIKAIRDSSLGFYQKSARGGCRLAQAKLGLIYQQGIQLPKDESIAEELFKEALLDKDPSVLYMIGEFQYYDRQTKESYRRIIAFYYLYEAMGMGYVPACNFIKNNYTSEEVEKYKGDEFEKGFKLYCRAIKRFEEKKYEESFDLYLQSESCGYDDATEFLVYYRKGKCLDRKNMNSHRTLHRILINCEKKRKQSLALPSKRDKRRQIVEKSKEQKNPSEIMQPKIMVKQDETQSLSLMLEQEGKKKEEQLFSDLSAPMLSTPDNTVVQQTSTTTTTPMIQPEVKVGKITDNQKKRREHLERRLSVQEMSPSNKRHKDYIKEGNQLLDRRSSMTLVRKSSKSDLSQEQKDKGRKKTLLRTQSMMLPKVSETSTEFQPSRQSPHPDYKRLSRKLSQRDLRSIGDIKLDKSTIIETLKSLKERGFISWKKSKFKNTISAKRLGDTAVKKLTIHLHGKNGKEWYERNDVISDFIDFVTACDPSLATEVQQIGRTKYIASQKEELVSEKK